MGKGRPRAVEKGVLAQSSIVSSSGLLNIPPGPVYYPTEDEFKDPLEFIHKIRPEAEPYGICKIVPPSSWKPPFALDLDSFTFPTKTQAIHQLQARPSSCDSKTFELEYNRFLEERCGKKSKKKIVFEGEELDLCKLFNAVKRYGGYDKVVEEKKWGEVSRFGRPGVKISECAKHVLCQLYREHLYDYEKYYNRLNQGKAKSRKGGMHCERKNQQGCDLSSSKRRRKNLEGERVKACKMEEEELDQICEQCRSGLHGEVMLLCDRCNKGWHIYCLSPPLKRVPPGNWYCLECLNSDKDSFGFVPGKQFSLEAFRRLAEKAKRKWVGSAPSLRVQLEKKFWEIVEGSAGEVEIMYGSDLDTSVYGSGFPRINDQRPASIEVEKWDEYCASPWNLNNLPKLRGSMLRAVHHGIAGVMVPWLYVGMLFSSFCWHFEDHCFYSMNYLHWGEPKCWYSVPGNEASAFEKVMRKSLPDLFDAQPDLLFQLVTMLNPSVLQENGVPVYSVLQEPGNFVITFPRSYHGGFNFGLNCAEAVNFAPADWLPHGGFGTELYQLYHKAAVLSHEELLYVVAKSDFDSKTSPYLKKELHRIYDREKTWRERLWRNGIVSSFPMSPRKHPEYVGTEEDPTCIICQQYLYLSAVVCRCRPSTFVCLEVKSGHVTLAQLAEEWLLSSCKILQSPYSREAYVKALKGAEQFLWAGSEMDPVRDLTKNLLQARNWAEDVRDSVSKVEKWSRHPNCDTEKVQLEHVNNLLSFDPVPCSEPALLKLKDYEQEARALSQEINSTLLKCSNVSIADWEIICTRVSDFPIVVNESEKLVQMLSSAKVWIDNVRTCISEKSPAAIEVDILYKLQSEISELPVQLPEVGILLGLIRQVELCEAQCKDMLNGSITLKKLEALFQEWGDFTVDVTQLKLLRQYQSDAISWISRWNDVLINIHEWEDQENVVNKLSCIQRDGLLLKIQVGELSRVDIELKKACCRVKALKALGSKMSLDFIQQLMMEATILQIEKERLFENISGDAIRTSEDICAILPSLGVVKDALSSAKSWLKMSEPFLVSNLSASPPSSSLLKVEDLKELVSQSNLLKISLKERSMLQTVLVVFSQKLSSKFIAMESAIKAGFSLGLDFGEIPKLQDTCSTLRWCLKALSFCSAVPQLEEVEMLMEVAPHLPVTYASSSLVSLLFDGVNWLKKAAKIHASCSRRKFKLSYAEEVLEQSKRIKVYFPLMICQLLNVIKKHNLWLEQVHLFFSLKPGDRSWTLLIELKELGSTDAFNCPELDMVLSEVQQVEQWKRRCQDVAGTSVGDVKTLLHALLEIKNTLDISLYIYNTSKGCKARELCIRCSNNFEDLELITCSVCNDRYHLRCKGPTLADTNDATLYVCHYCHFLERGKISQKGGSPLILGGKRAEFNELVELLSDAEDFSVWIEERSVLCQLVEKALACKACLTEVVDFALAYHDEDLSIIVEKLSVAMKAMEVAGVRDHQGNCNFELALARNSWRVRANKLLGGPQKPLIQQNSATFDRVRELQAGAAVKHTIVVLERSLTHPDMCGSLYGHLNICNDLNMFLGTTEKEGKDMDMGLAVSISPEDHFWRKLTDVKHHCTQWADKAKKVSIDSGALGLDKVFELITEGENLPVHFEKELKLLRDRSMLYCICRKPNDHRAMIACDKCDEWYHFDCIKLSSPPKIYICPACNLQTEDCYSPPTMALDRSIGSKCEEPQTPSPRRREFRCKSRKPKLPVTSDDSYMLRRSSGIECLLWRNRKPFRRAARKRSKKRAMWGDDERYDELVVETTRAEEAVESVEFNLLKARKRAVAIRRRVEEARHALLNLEEEMEREESEVGGLEIEKEHCCELHSRIENEPNRLSWEQSLEAGARSVKQDMVCDLVKRKGQSLLLLALPNSTPVGNLGFESSQRLSHTITPLDAPHTVAVLPPPEKKLVSNIRKHYGSLVNTQMKYVKPLSLFQELMKMTSLERGRLLGLDVGDKYVGLAVSDTSNQIASPLSVLLRKKSNIDLMAGDFQSLAVQVKLLIDDLCKTGKLEGLRYTFWDECFTSKPLDLHPVMSKTIIDKFAAVGILQGYLDYVNRTPTLKLTP
ncbi:transcription factor jumonji (jmjC) domain-containing protein [Actinidia rufa]|uniref:Transcription factor jumonji (JmjC) domain-containing protein n=1 Tax=Actinidia rufa TaxID=165716 RepID=A0A7J0DKG6_9ERIC|nr:transcription factor jumonji (jmjC) domain-containing protein [Actinidia rufa]